MNVTGQHPQPSFVRFPVERAMVQTPSQEVWCNQHDGVIVSVSALHLIK